eukprot:5945747-Pyramimonas_sp.AAC.1
MSLGHLENLKANFSAASSSALRLHLSRASGPERGAILEMEGALKRGIPHEINEKFSWGTELPH